MGRADAGERGGRERGPPAVEPEAMRELEVRRDRAEGRAYGRFSGARALSDGIK